MKTIIIAPPAGDRLHKDFWAAIPKGSVVLRRARTTAKDARFKANWIVADWTGSSLDGGQVYANLDHALVAAVERATP